MSSVQHHHVSEFDCRHSFEAFPEAAVREAIRHFRIWSDEIVSKDNLQLGLPGRICRGFLFSEQAVFFPPLDRKKGKKWMRTKEIRARAGRKKGESNDAGPEEEMDYFQEVITTDGTASK